MTVKSRYDDDSKVKQDMMMTVKSIYYDDSIVKI